MSMLFSTDVSCCLNESNVTHKSIRLGKEPDEVATNPESSLTTCAVASLRSSMERQSLRLQAELQRQNSAFYELFGIMGECIFDISSAGNKKKSISRANKIRFQEALERGFNSKHDDKEGPLGIISCHQSKSCWDSTDSAEDADYITIKEVWSNKGDMDRFVRPKTIHDNYVKLPNASQRFISTSNENHPDGTFNMAVYHTHHAVRQCKKVYFVPVIGILDSLDAVDLAKDASEEEDMSLNSQPKKRKMSPKKVQSPSKKSEEELRAERDAGVRYSNFLSEYVDQDAINEADVVGLAIENSGIVLHIVVTKTPYGTNYAFLYVIPGSAGPKKNKAHMPVSMDVLREIVSRLCPWAEQYLGVIMLYQSEQEFDKDMPYILGFANKHSEPERVSQFCPSRFRYNPLYNLLLFCCRFSQFAERYEGGISITHLASRLFREAETSDTKTDKAADVECRTETAGVMFDILFYHLSKKTHQIVEHSSAPFDVGYQQMKLDELNEEVTKWLCLDAKGTF